MTRADCIRFPAKTCRWKVLSQRKRSAGASAFASGSDCRYLEMSVHELAEMLRTRLLGKRDVN